MNRPHGRHRPGRVLTDMNGLFSSSVFNGDISRWDTSRVTSMDSTFLESVFNRNISSWDTSQVTSMRMTFLNARSFNQDLSGWKTNNVTSALWFSSGSALTPAQRPSGLPVT